MRPPSGEEHDSFEHQTDRMTEADAHAELLKRVRATREAIGVPYDGMIIVEGETAKGEFHKINDITAVLGEAFSIDEFMKTSFAAWWVLQEIEEMLDSNPRSFWKLRLKRRHTGKRMVPLAVEHDICHAYGEAIIERGTPSKVIIGRLAKEYGVPDTTIRGIIRRSRKRKHGHSDTSLLALHDYFKRKRAERGKK